jgi:hypothetical protein
MIFEVLSTVNVSAVVSWVVTPCGLVVGYRRFGGTYCRIFMSPYTTADLSCTYILPYVLHVKSITLHTYVHTAVYIVCQILRRIRSRCLALFCAPTSMGTEVITATVTDASVWRRLPSGLLRRVVDEKFTDVSEVFAASIIRAISGRQSRKFSLRCYLLW